MVGIDSDLRRMIHDKASEEEMTKQARLGSRGIMADGISQVLAGLTTVEEILRVTQEG